MLDRCLKACCTGGVFAAKSCMCRRHGHRWTQCLNDLLPGRAALCVTIDEAILSAITASARLPARVIALLTRSPPLSAPRCRRALNMSVRSSSRMSQSLSVSPNNSRAPLTPPRLPRDHSTTAGARSNWEEIGKLCVVDCRLTRRAFVHHDLLQAKPQLWQGSPERLHRRLVRAFGARQRRAQCGLGVGV